MGGAVTDLGGAVTDIGGAGLGAVTDLGGKFGDLIMDDDEVSPFDKHIKGNPCTKIEIVEDVEI